MKFSQSSRNVLLWRYIRTLKVVLILLNSFTIVVLMGFWFASYFARFIVSQAGVDPPTFVTIELFGGRILFTDSAFVNSEGRWPEADRGLKIRAHPERWRFLFFLAPVQGKPTLFGFGTSIKTYPLDGGGEMKTAFMAFPIPGIILGCGFVLGSQFFFRHSAGKVEDWKERSH